MWLKVGIPVLVLLGVVAVRVVYYLFWRKHWDRRPAQRRDVEADEVIVVRETQSHVDSHTPSLSRGEGVRPNDVGR